jgi:hypothetical protein
MLPDKDFEEAVADLKAKLQRQREIHRDEVHHSLILALHSNSH